MYEEKIVLSNLFLGEFTGNPILGENIIVSDAKGQKQSLNYGVQIRKYWYHRIVKKWTKSDLKPKFKICETVDPQYEKTHN